MQIYTGSGICNGCHSCYNACPQNAITMVEDQEGFLYPEIDQSKCIQCGLCQKVCKVMECRTIEENVQAFSCVNKNDEIRMKSSSGGVFSAFAEAIINKGGVVFGAAYTDNFIVRHICINNINDISKLRGSKYVQSTIGDTFREVKNYLDQDKYVFFTGTPCQINGLLSYLRKSYDKLYTQDIICHGVGSPLVWRKYLEKRKREVQGNITYLSMRDKTHGWRGLHMRIDCDNSIRYLKRQDSDTYLNGFLSNLFLRPSCYNCDHKYLPRKSDITVADFWDVQAVTGTVDDNKGVSLILINSEKGKCLFENIKDQLCYTQLEINNALANNYAVLNSVCMHNKRIKFFSKIQEEDCDKLINKCLQPTLKELFCNQIMRVKRVIKRIKN